MLSAIFQRDTSTRRGVAHRERGAHWKFAASQARRGSDVREREKRK
jgi:hypothetical protein